MLSVREHGVEDYAVLRDMDGSDVGVLSEADRACLAELGRYLGSSDGWRRFAVWLLHKHFEPAAGEVFVERAFRGQWMTQTAPVARSGLSAGLAATALRFDDSVGAGVGVVGMEFAEPADFGATSPLGDDDEAVLAGIAERLRAHGMTERFGVRLIRDPLGIGEHELLHETCDSVARTLHNTVTRRGAVPAEHTIETTWRWKVIHGQAGPMVMQECQATCQAVGEGHDIAHKSFIDDDFGND